MSEREAVLNHAASAARECGIRFTGVQDIVESSLRHLLVGTTIDLAAQASVSPEETRISGNRILAGVLLSAIGSIRRVDEHCQAQDLTFDPFPADVEDAMMAVLKKHAATAMSPSVATQDDSAVA